MKKLGTVVMEGNCVRLGKMCPDLLLATDFIDAGGASAKPRAVHEVSF